MKNNLEYTMLLTLFLWVGCSTIPSAMNMPAKLAGETSTPKPLPELPTPTPTILKAPGKQCLGSQQTFPSNIVGQFVLSGYYDLYKPGLELHKSSSYILIPASGNKLQLPQENGDELSSFVVSPDRKWLVYYAQQSGKSGQWFVIGNDGKLLKQYPGKEYPQGDWQVVVGWIDDEHLLISKFAKENPYPSIVFDPFSGKNHDELLPNFPGIYSGRPWMDWGRYASTETIYNSDLSLVIYPTSATTKNPISKIILWDIKAKKTLAEVRDPWASSSTPLWSPRGKDFIVDAPIAYELDHPNQDELMRVGVDGKVERLTHLLDLYDEVQILNFSQSLDGRYIALWFYHGASSSNVKIYQLAIFDTKTEQTKIACVNTIARAFPPVWSPSGYQLLAAGYLDNLDNYGTVFIDVENSVLAQVEKGVIPVGWMAEPP